MAPLSETDFLTALAARGRLKEAVADALKGDTTGRHLSLGVRLGHPGAVNAALTVIRDEKAKPESRLDLIRLLGEVPQAAGPPETIEKG